MSEVVTSKQTRQRVAERLAEEAWSSGVAEVTFGPSGARHDLEVRESGPDAYQVEAGSADGGARPVAPEPEHPDPIRALYELKVGLA